MESSASPSVFVHSVPPKTSLRREQPPVYPRWFGGSASCLAVLVSHPLDLVKVRLQTVTTGSKQGVLSTAWDLLQTQGPRGFYNGLSAGVLRQLTYGSTRFAIYEGIKEKASTRGPVTLSTLIAASALSGAAGGLVGNPADIANVRMQHDRSLPPSRQLHYRSVFDALARIGLESGISGYFRGVGPNCARAAVMTSCQLGSYDGFKAWLTGSFGMKDDSTTQLLSSVLASLLATTLCSPIDVVKTQLMSSTGREAASALGIMKALTRAEGLRWVFRGWIPSFVRLGPHTATTLMVLEQQRRLYRRYYID